MHQQHRQGPLPQNNMRRDLTTPREPFRGHGSKGPAYNQNRQHQQRQRESNSGHQNFQQNTQQGFNFRSYNQTRGTSNRSLVPGQSSNAVNTNVMNSLKKQLKSTLKQNRKSNN